MRRKFVIDLFECLRTTNYVWLEREQAFPQELGTGSDLNILIKKRDSKKLFQLIRQYASSSKIKCNGFLNGKSIRIIFSDGSFLRLNLYFNLREGSWQTLRSSEVFEKSVVDGEYIRTMCNEHYFEMHMLRALLRRSDLPSNIAAYFMNLDFTHRSKVFGHVSLKYRLIKNRLDELLAFEAHNLRTVKKVLLKQSGNKFPLRGFFLLLSYYFNLMLSLSCQKLLITQSGGDNFSVADLLLKLRTSYGLNVKLLEAERRPQLVSAIISGLNSNRKLVGMYRILPCLLMNRCIVLTGANISGLLSGPAQATRDVVKVFIRDSDVQKHSELPGIGKKIPDLLQVLGIDPKFYSIIIVEKIPIDNKSELLMKELVRAN